MASVAVICGHELPPLRRSKGYCSDACRREAHNARRRVANGFQRCCLCDRVGGPHWAWCRRAA